MVPRTDAAARTTREALPLAILPVLATFLSLDQLARTLGAGPGFGVAFPFPTGLPTLWTYVAVPGTVLGGGVGTVAGSIPLLVVGLVVASMLEAGFLGSLDDRIEGEPADVVGNAGQYTVAMIGVNLVRFAVVLLALPFVVLGPLVLVAVVALSYLVYGLPFVVVVEDRGVVDALSRTGDLALSGGRYAAFGFTHLAVGAVASVVLTLLVRTLGLVAVVPAALLVAAPAVFVATYGLLVFRDLTEREPPLPDGDAATDD